MSTPNLNLTTIPANTLQPSVAFNESMTTLDALVQLAVEDKDATAPPTTTLIDFGKRWIVGPSATGAWYDHDDEIALCVGVNLWQFLVPAEGWRADVRDEDLLYRFDGSAWAAILTSVADGSITGAKLSTSIRTPVASDVAVLGDANNVVQMDVGSANTFTVPPNSSVAFPVGSSIEVWQKGVGQTTITAGSGVTILYNAAHTLKLAAQHSGCSLRKVATDTWRLVGDMEAAP